MNSYIINVDSRYRDKHIYPNSGSFRYELSRSFKNIKYIRLSSIELPNMYYTNTIKKDNVSFVIIFNNNLYDIKIQEGSYTSDSIINTINDIFSTINNKNGTNFLISFDYINSKCTISNINGNIFSINFKNNTSYYSLGYLLGFRNEMYNNSTSYTSESILDVIGDTYIFLKINDYGNMYSNVTNTGVLAKIIINDNKGGVVYDNEGNFICKTHIFHQPVDIAKLVVQLIDPMGNTIDMLHMDYSFTLEIGQFNNYDIKRLIEKIGPFI